MLKKVHASHQGTEACIRRAKDVLFWPGMNSEITNMVSQCAACNEYQSRQQKEPLMTPDSYQTMANGSSRSVCS